MRGWALVQELRERVGLVRGEKAGKADVERLLDVVPGLCMEEGHALLRKPYLYTFGDGRGVIRAPLGWAKRIEDHEALLEEVLHHCLGGYADSSATIRGTQRGHAREEARITDHALLWWLGHAHGCRGDDEDLAAESGRAVEDVSRFWELQARG